MRENGYTISNKTFSSHIRCHVVNLVNISTESQKPGHKALYMEIETYPKAQCDM
jgi:hypothetical protein